LYNFTVTTYLFDTENIPHFQQTRSNYLRTEGGRSEDEKIEVLGDEVLVVPWSSRMSSSSIVSFKTTAAVCVCFTYTTNSSSIYTISAFLTSLSIATKVFYGADRVSNQQHAINAMHHIKTLCPASAECFTSINSENGSFC
jgi:hypothetical protein